MSEATGGESVEESGAVAAEDAAAVTAPPEARSYTLRVKRETVLTLLVVALIVVSGLQTVQLVDLSGKVKSEVLAKSLEVTSGGAIGSAASAASGAAPAQRGGC